MKTLVDKVHTVVEQVSHITQIRKKNTNETVWLIQGAYNIYIQAEQKNKTKQKKSTYLKSLTREVTMHIRNAQGDPLISVFDLVSGFILIAISLSHWILVSRRM